MQDFSARGKAAIERLELAPIYNRNSQQFVGSPIVLPARPNDAVQDLVKDRHRRPKIEPDKLRAIRIKGFAGAESDPGLVEEELERRGREFQLAAIKPCEIGRLGRMEADFRRFH